MAFVIDTPQGIDVFRFLAIRSAVKFQADTGMQMTRFSAIKAAKAAYGVKGRTAKAVLKELDVMKAQLDDDIAAGRIAMNKEQEERLKAQAGDKETNR